VAERMGLAFKISQDAEVISSIGVALALVRESVERVIPNPSAEDLQRIKREAFDAAVRLGAAPENVEVTIEVDAQTQRVRATAAGASEMRAQDLLKDVSEDEAREIAASSMGLPRERVVLVAATDQVRVFQGEVEERRLRLFRRRRRPVRAVDREGVIRVQRSDAVVVGASAGSGLDQLKRVWEQVTIYNGDSVITPDVFVIAGRRVVDLTGVSALDQALAIGLVNRVVAREELEAATRELSTKLASRAPLALRLAKAALNLSARVPLDSGLAFEVVSQSVLFESRDKKEGISVFLEKRKPLFQGE